MQTNAASPAPRPAADSVLAFVLIMAATALVAAIGGLISGGESDPWYQSLNRAPGNPPGVVFGIVWPVLYVAMAAGACMTWSAAGGWKTARPAMQLYFAQLALNLGWSCLFFGLHQPLLALADILLLGALVVMMIAAFRKHSRTAALLQAPYLAWLCFATYLNAWIVIFN